MKNDDGTLAINRSRCVFSGNDVIWSLPRPAASVCFSWSAGTDDHYRESSNTVCHRFCKGKSCDPGKCGSFYYGSIEELKLPQSVKDVLLENNNSEFYRLLGVDQFGEYISTCLSDMLINTLGSVLVFAASYIVIHLVIRWLNLLSRLPIICGLNQMAGGIVGLAEGFLLLWLAGFILSFFTETPMGQMLEAQVNSSIWLSLIYRYNLMNMILGSIINGIL